MRARANCWLARGFLLILATVYLAVIVQVVQQGDFGIEHGIASVTLVSCMLHILDRAGPIVFVESVSMAEGEFAHSVGKLQLPPGRYALKVIVDGIKFQGPRSRMVWIYKIGVRLPGVRCAVRVGEIVDGRRHESVFETKITGRKGFYSWQWSLQGPRVISDVGICISAVEADISCVGPINPEISISKLISPNLFRRG